MKSIYVFLFLFIPLLVNAQEDLNRTWFLTELTMDGNAINIPNEEFQEGYPTLSILINDTEGQIEGIGICNGFFSDEITGPVSATETTITFNISPSLAICETSEEINFELAYFNFLGAPESQEFNYVITEQGDFSLALTITTSNGDVALYNSINPNIPSGLIDTSWFLNSYEIDGTLIEYPTNYPGIITLNMLEDGSQEIETACTGGTSTYSAYDYFGVPTYQSQGIAQLTIDCSIPAFDNFDGMHFELLESHTYSYEIIEEDSNIFSLILTNVENGDRIFYTDTLLNTEEFDQDILIQLFPNPSSDKITITGERIKNIQFYQIIDIHGRVVFQNTFDTIIDVESLATGMYFLKLQGIQLETTRRFIKK